MKTQKNARLSALRKQIDQEDQKILKALASRFKTVKKIGIFKKCHSLPVTQKNRWATVVSSRLKLAKKLGLDAKLVNRLLTLIHDEALKIQKK